MYLLAWHYQFALMLDCHAIKNNYKDAFIALASSYYWLIIPKYIYLTGKWNYVEIEFSNNRLRKRFNEAKAMQKAFGTERAKRVQVVMTALKAAPNLGVLGPPYSPRTAAMS